MKAESPTKPDNRSLTPVISQGNTTQVSFKSAVISEEERERDMKEAKEMAKANVPKENPLTKTPSNNPFKSREEVIAEAMNPGLKKR